ncbi:hypothetical protein [Pandoraea apista]|uniref:hypothetical protein n=1 Tax=Pandoraea apista TaxID=93218 RepID=UPI002F93F3FB
MKKTFLMAAMFLAAGITSAHAYTKDVVCMAYSDLFEQVGYSRDRGESPEHTLEYMKSLFLTVKEPPISEKQIKNVINLVYFDPAFADARGKLFKKQIWDLCANDWKAPKQFQPLK